jgi:hypothetical protein
MTAPGRAAAALKNRKDVDVPAMVRFRRQGLSIDDIVEKTGWNHNMVWRRLHEAGL